MCNGQIEVLQVVPVQALVASGVRVLGDGNRISEGGLER